MAEKSEQENKEAIAQIGRDQAARAGVSYEEVDSVPVSTQDPSEAFQGEPPAEVENLQEVQPPAPPAEVLETTPEG